MRPCAWTDASDRQSGFLPDFVVFYVMQAVSEIVVFSLDGQRYALNVWSVERVIRVVEVTPLPKAPEIVMGVIDLAGQIVPVMNIRRRFRLPDREIALTVDLIVARTSRRVVAMIVDAVVDIIKVPEASFIPATDILPKLDYVDGLLGLADGIILIHDLDTFLSMEEESLLEDSLHEV